jgi:heme-degrading monooxygenase HmoA
MSDTFSAFVKALKRPLFAVIFQTPRTAGHPHWGYMSDIMIEFAAKQPGFLGVKTQGPAKGFSITMSFWESEEAIKAWETSMEQKPAGYKILISKVEADHVRKPVA